MPRFETQTWNHRLQATGISRGSAFSLTYAYCASGASCATNNGNVVSQTIGHAAGAVQNYTFDTLGRLAAASESSAWSRSFDADQWGNSWVSTNSGITLASFTPVGSSNFDSNNRLQIQGSNYDLAGNQTVIGGYAFAYDGESRLAESTLGGASAGYSYDGEGRRVKKVNGSRTVVYVYGVDGNLIQEYDTATPAETGRQYLAQDMLGSTRVVFNSTGTAVRCVDYLPFGEQIPQGVGAGRNGACWATSEEPRQKFTGKEREGADGAYLDFFEARYFSAAQGRFTTTDPLNVPVLQEIDPKKFAEVQANPSNWNQYAYAHNNPLSKTDPDGYLTIIVPGTWNNHWEWENSEFRKLVERSFGEKANVLHNHYMKNDKDARSAAAKSIVDMVKGHRFAEGEKLNIVAHSHGGNAVFEATKTGLSHKIDNLVTLGTPIRGDYRPDFGKIDNFLNVFSRNDQVQTIGGGLYGLGSADRQIRLPHVQNLDATRTATGHGDLWERVQTWKTIIEPRLKK